MANRNAKLIERVLKDFSLNIGSGGTEVVNELPEVGKEHTVYELKKKVPGQFNWFFEMFDCEYDYIKRVPFPPFVALDEDMKNELLTQDKHMIIYQKDTDKLIMKGKKSTETFDSIDNGTFVMHGSTTLYILKSFDGFDEKTGDYKATTIGGKHVYLYEHEAGEETSPDDTHVGLLLTQANELAFLGQPPVIIPYMNNDMTGNNVEVQFLDTTSQLPTAKDVVEQNMMPESFEQGIEFVTIDYCAWVKETELIYNRIKLETDREDPVNYYWDMKERKFYTHDPSGGEADVVYEGPLVWEERGTVPEVTSLTVEELIQASYNREPICINLNASETTVSEYYVYANGSWVNLDNVGEIVMPVMSIGDGGFHYTGLDLKYFDFYINGIKAECVQYGTLVIPGDEGTAGNDMVYPIGYLKGIVLPTHENNHYSVEVRFTGTAEQLSGMKYLFVSAITFESRTIDQITFKEPMTLEFDGLHELIINCREGNM